MSVLPFVCLAVSRPLHSSAVKAAATFAIPVDPRLLAHPVEATLPSGLSAFYSQTLVVWQAARLLFIRRGQE